MDDYLSRLGVDERDALQAIRAIVKQLVPDATETISYAMPVFKYRNKYLLGFAAFKDHMSIFPGPEAIDYIKDDLSNYKTAKGTIQFTVTHPLLEPLIKKIVLYCVARISNKYRLT
jgi:uncharacterized protein YdhG (YjbR/CyaY superfamily)